jgi:hypothetical protein
MDRERVSDAIRFQAQVSKVTTLADGGIRLVLDLAETEIEVAKQMMLARQQGAILEVAAVAVLQSLTNGETETNERAKRNPLDVAGG